MKKRELVAYKAPQQQREKLKTKEAEHLRPVT